MQITLSTLSGLGSPRPATPSNFPPRARASGIRWKAFFDDVRGDPPLAVDLPQHLLHGRRGAQLLNKALVATQLGVQCVIKVNLQEPKRSQVLRDRHHRGLRELGKTLAGLQPLTARPDKLQVEVLNDPSRRAPPHGDDAECGPWGVRRKPELDQELLRRLAAKDELRPPGLLQQVQEECGRLIVAGDEEELPLQHLQEHPLAELGQPPNLTLDHVL